jgi:hypothetical protein
MKTHIALLVMLLAWQTHAQTTNTAALPALDDLLRDPGDDAALFASWPPVGAVAVAAEQALPKNIRNPQFWRSRQKLSGLLPDLRIGIATDEGNYDRYALFRDEADRNRLDDYTLEDGIREYDSYYVSVTWNLSKLVFHNDELEIAMTERYSVQLKKEVRTKVIDLYFRLKEARLRLSRDLAVTEDDRIRLEMAAAAYEAMLDDYTDRFFSRYQEEQQAAQEEGPKK